MLPSQTSVVVVGIIIVIVMVILYMVWTRRRTPRYVEKERIARLAKLRKLQKKTADESFEHAVIVDNILSETDVDRYDRVREAVAEYQNTLQHINDVDGGHPRTTFMIDRIDNFREAQLMDNENEAWINDVLFNLGRMIVVTSDNVSRNTIDHRVAAAVAKSDVKAEISAEILTSSKQTTSDPQNVHDYTVNKNMRDTIMVLRSNIGHYDQKVAYDEMDTWLANMPASAKLDKAIRVFMGISEDNMITTFNSTELEIITLVWQRIKDPQNGTNVALMKEALYNSLVDCYDERGSIVCLNGRCTRYLQSLVLLDFNPIIGKAVTNEAYKNQIYDQTKNIIDDEVATWNASTDERDRAVAQSFLGNANVVVDPEYEAAFVREVKAKIDDNLDTYVGILIATEIERLRLDCYAAIDF